MRTTVTIDPDVEALLAQAMKERGLSFKEALNAALRAGLLAGTAGKRAAPVKLPVFDLGAPLVRIDRAQQLADALEDDELVRKLQLKK